MDSTLLRNSASWKPGTVHCPTGSDAFAWLIDPVTASEFERNFYEQRLCLIARTDPGYYAGLLDVQDLDVVLGTHNVSHPKVSLVRGDGDVPKSAYTHGSGQIDPLGVAKQFDEGATVIFNQLHQRVPMLGEFCASLGRVFGSRLQTNIYLTPPNAQGFKPHWDTHDVFVLQISGRKSWSVYDTKVTLPLKGQSFDPDRDVPGPVTDQFELGAGSAVYIPRGLMHSARSSDETSLHITLGLIAFTWTDFLLESVAAAALQDESLRQSLPCRFADDSFPAATRDRLVRGKLEALGSRLAPAEVWRHFRQELLAVNAPLFTDLFSSRLCTDTLTLTSRVRRRRGLLVACENRADGCALCFCGQELRFPSRMLPAVEFVATTDVFVVGHLPDCLNKESKVIFVSRLVKDGLLQADCDT